MVNIKTDGVAGDGSKSVVTRTQARAILSEGLVDNAVPRTLAVTTDTT